MVHLQKNPRHPGLRAFTQRTPRDLYKCRKPRSPVNHQLQMSPLGWLTSSQISSPAFELYVNGIKRNTYSSVSGFVPSTLCRDLGEGSSHPPLLSLLQHPIGRHAILAFPYRTQCTIGYFIRWEFELLFPMWRCYTWRCCKHSSVHLSIHICHVAVGYIPREKDSVVGTQRQAKTLTK